jgi:hypothetical protein
MKQGTQSIFSQTQYNNSKHQEETAREAKLFSGPMTSASAQGAVL